MPGPRADDEAQPEQAAVDLRYAWSEVRVLVTADAQGTQLAAELEVELDGCTARYEVLGLYPAVACLSDADCRDEGNGINPDFAVRCADAIGLCVLAEAPPAYE